MILATPWFTIGAVYFLPPTAIYLLWWCRRHGDRRRTIWSLAALATSALTAMGVYLVAYRPVNKATIGDYWSSTALETDAGRFAPLARRLLAGDPRRCVGLGAPDRAGGIDVAGAARPVASLVVGLASLGRRWPPLLAILAGAWCSIVVASIVVGWPMTPARVNLALFVFVYVTIGFGVLRIVGTLAGERAAIVGVASVALVVALWPMHPTDLPNGEFLRGQTADLRVVADSPAQENLVLTYHFASKWYAEDALATARPGGRHYTVVPETYTDTRVYDPGFVARLVFALPCRRRRVVRHALRRRARGRGASLPGTPRAGPDRRRPRRRSWILGFVVS